MAVAWLAANFRPLLSGTGYVRMLRLLGLLLAAFGVSLLVKAFAYLGRV